MQLQEQEVDGPEPAQLLLRLPLHASLNSCVDFPLFRAIGYHKRRSRSRAIHAGSELKL